jgi:hypothetical protein
MQCITGARVQLYVVCAKADRCGTSSYENFLLKTLESGMSSLDSEGAETCEASQDGLVCVRIPSAAPDVMGRKYLVCISGIIRDRRILN